MSEDHYVPLWINTTISEYLVELDCKDFKLARRQVSDWTSRKVLFLIEGTNRLNNYFVLWYRCGPSGPIEIIKDTERFNALHTNSCSAVGFSLLTEQKEELQEDIRTVVSHYDFCMTVPTPILAGCFGPWPYPCLLTHSPSPAKAESPNQQMLIRKTIYISSCFWETFLTNYLQN